jgi:hypothetical protein
MREDDMNEFEWFDLWCERHSHLMEKEAYGQLVECCRERRDRHPDDLHAVEALAEAYVLNNQSQAAIDMLTPYYMKDPEHPLYERALLDALLAMGKRIEDFPWRTPPKVLNLTKDVVDACHTHLQPKRQPRTVFDLLFMFMGSAYLLFTEEDLLTALSSDERFVVSDKGGVPQISVRRKQRKAQNITSEHVSQGRERPSGNAQR